MLEMWLFVYYPTELLDLLDSKTLCPPRSYTATSEVHGCAPSSVGLSHCLRTVCSPALFLKRFLVDYALLYLVVMYTLAISHRMLAALKHYHWKITMQIDG